MRERFWSIIFTVTIVSAVLLNGEITTVYAADASESSGMKAVKVIVMIAAFIAASVISALFTYRIRMKKISSGATQDDHADASDVEI